MWKRLKGKDVKIVIKDDNRTLICFGKVVDANDSFLVERDLKGKLHFLNVSNIERVSVLEPKGTYKS